MHLVSLEVMLSLFSPGCGVKFCSPPWTIMVEVWSWNSLATITWVLVNNPASWTPTPPRPPEAEARALPGNLGC